MAKPLDKDKVYVEPVMGKMEYLYGESLMLFGPQKYRGKTYKPFYGIGLVMRVVKGDKQDLVYIRFGCFQNVKHRLVVVYHNHARRQILTLKRGQICQVYGICRHYQTDITLNGEKVKGVKLGLFAIAINGWYVPTMLDIKRLPTNDDLVEMSEKEKDLANTFDDLLNEFMSGTGEDDG